MDQMEKYNKMYMLDKVNFLKVKKEEETGG